MTKYNNALHRYGFWLFAPLLLPIVVALSFICGLLISGWGARVFPAFVFVGVAACLQILSYRLWDAMVGTGAGRISSEQMDDFFVRCMRTCLLVFVMSVVAVMLGQYVRSVTFPKPHVPGNEPTVAGQSRT